MQIEISTCLVGKVVTMVHRPGWCAGLLHLAALAFLGSIPVEARTLLRHGRQAPPYAFPSASEPASMLAFGGMALPPDNSYGPFDLQHLPPALQQSSDSGVGAVLSAASVSVLAASLQGAAPPMAPPLVSDGADSSIEAASAESTRDSAAKDSDTAAAAQALAEDESIASHEGDDDDGQDEEETTVSETDTDSQEVPNTNALKMPRQVKVSAPPLDDIARATLQVQQETEKVKRTRVSKSPPLVSMVICSKAAKKLKAMSCSLVTEISGYPEGCECRMKAKKCPGVLKDLGFTGVSPSVPLSPPQLDGTTVILCMYWQWLKPPDRSNEEAAAALETKQFATQLVKAANFHAEQGAKTVAGVLYGMTPPPMTVTTTYAMPATPVPIFEPIRFLSTTPYFPFIGFGFGPGPAPAPMGTLGVSFSIRINSLNYALISSNPVVFSSLVQKLRNGVGLLSGVHTEYVSLQFKAGSVIMHAFISPDGGIPDAVLVQKLASSATFLGVLTNYVLSVPGIASFSMGTVNIDWLQMPSMGMLPFVSSPAPAPVPLLSPAPVPAPYPAQIRFAPFTPIFQVAPWRSSPMPGPAPGPAAPGPAPFFG